MSTEMLSSKLITVIKFLFEKRTEQRRMSGEKSDRQAKSYVNKMNIEHNSQQQLNGEKKAQ